MDSAMSAAVSGLKAQSTALSTISNNLANSSTTGYKTVNTQFLSLLTQQSSASYFPSGGVTAVSRQNLEATGNITSTTTTTDMAIDGTGLFCVQNGKVSSANPYSNIYFTRNGAFSPDESGDLKLSGTNYYLMGYKTNADGTYASTVSNPDDLSSAEVVNIEEYTTSANASSYYTLKAILPAEEDVSSPVGTTQFTTSMQVYDSLGVAQIYSLEWSKTATNTWTLTIDNPVDTSGNTSTLTGFPATHTLVFNTDGTLDTVDGSTTGTITVDPGAASTYADGATAPDFSVNIGSDGETTNVGSLTQYDTGEKVPTVQTKSTATDGYQFGELTGVTVDSDGYVVAAYSNNQTAKIYKVRLATFNNEDGLTAKSDGVYAQNSASGNYVLSDAGANGTGSIDGQALEASNVDTSTEFSNMIVCQQAYSASSQVIGTDKQMFQSLLQQMQ